MVLARLISFNKKLSKEFIEHVETTNNLCIYKLGSHYIPQNIFFPNAKAVTLINCSESGILNILNPKAFPNLNTINYLSRGTSYTVHDRFKSDIRWIFPDKNYEYYDNMVKSGYGKKDPELIKRYIKNKTIVDGKNGFDISFRFDLNIPGYGIINGEWYQTQFYEYLVKKQNDGLSPQIVSMDGESFRQELEENQLQMEFVRKNIEQSYLEEVFKDSSNHS